MNWKNMGLLLALCLMVTGVCGQANAQDARDTLAKIKESGTITFGVRNASIPFSYQAGTAAVGYSVDLCNQIAEKIKADLKLPKLQVKQFEVTPANRLALLAAGATDIDCGSTTNTAERAKLVSFSVTTFVGSTRLLVKKSANIRSVQDIKGKTVVATSGSTSIAKITDLSKALDLKIVLVHGKDHPESLTLLESDRAVAFVEDDILLASLAATSKTPDAFTRVSIDGLPAEPYALGIRKNDPAFKKLVDDTLKSLFSSGQINAIYDKWFMHSIEGRNVNLATPMSDRLKRLLKSPTDNSDPTAYK